MNLLLVLAAFLSTTAFANDWNCPKLPNHENVKYKATCNAWNYPKDGYIEFKEISIVVGDNEYLLRYGYNNASAFCSGMNLRLVNYRNTYSYYDTNNIINLLDSKGEFKPYFTHDDCGKTAHTFERIICK